VLASSLLVFDANASDAVKHALWATYGW